MTDHAKHIDELEALKHACDGQYDECLTAAIELMLAATPKDAEAEREYCEHQVVQRGDQNVGDEYFRKDVEELVRERAAARAEGYEAGKHAADEGLQADTNTVLELAEARAEIERLCAELQQTKAALASAHILLDGAFG